MYIIWCFTKGGPTKKHSSQLDAETEAKRLAEENPGHHFIVFKAVVSYTGTVEVKTDCSSF